MRFITQVLFVLFALLAASLFAQSPSPSPNLALTPPMGWNSWNKFACNVSEDLIKSTADAMVRSGMKDAGYQYIVIEDCWQVGRDKDGDIVADPQRFPSGIKSLADYVHSLGLKVRNLLRCRFENLCRSAWRAGARISGRAQVRGLER